MEGDECNPLDFSLLQGLTSTYALWSSPWLILHFANSTPSPSIFFVQKMWSLSVSKIWKLRVPVSKCISPGTNVYGRLEFSYIRYMLYMLAHTRAVPCPTSQGSHDHPGLQSHCAVEVCRHWSDQRCVYGVRRRLWWLPSRWNQHVASLVGLWAVHDPILGRMACHTEVGKARWPHVQLWLILILPPLIAIGIPW